MAALLLLVAPACDSTLGSDCHDDAGSHDAAASRDSGASPPDAGRELDAALDAEAAALDAAPDAPAATRCPEAPSGPAQAVYPDPAPDGLAVAQQVAAEHPDWLQNSCVDFGGDNQFLFEVVRQLRLLDDRWGLNWKRGNEGDLSQDAVDYLFGEGPCEGNQDVFIIDMIGGHCGDAPTVVWNDVTADTLNGGTIGRWTLAGQDL